MKRWVSLSNALYAQTRVSCAPQAGHPGHMLQGLTYKAALFLDLCYQLDNHPVQRLNRRMGGMPVMVKSRACHLRHMSRAKLVAAKEESTEMGGYFICNGIERIIRMLIQQRRHYIMALKRGAYSKRGTNYTDAATLLRCLSRPSSRAPQMYNLEGAGVLGAAAASSTQLTGEVDLCRSQQSRRQRSC